MPLSLTNTLRNEPQPDRENAYLYHLNRLYPAFLSGISPFRPLTIKSATCTKFKSWLYKKRCDRKQPRVNPNSKRKYCIKKQQRRQLRRLYLYFIVFHKQKKSFIKHYNKVFYDGKSLAGISFFRPIRSYGRIFAFSRYPE